MFGGANATKQPIGAGNASSDQHVVDGVFCMCLQLADVSQILMEWWKGSTMFFGADAFNHPIQM